MKKCPQGFICLENATIFFSIIIFILLVYFMYTMCKTKEINQHYHHHDQNIPIIGSGSIRNVYENPYVPPLKNDHYVITRPIPTSIAVIDTSNQSFQQVGVLIPENIKSESIMPLFGRRISRNGKYNYYCVVNQFVSVKMNVIINGKNGLTEYGVDELNNGNIVIVEGVGKHRVNLYENENIRYLV